MLSTQIQHLTSVNMDKLAAVLFFSTLVGNTLEDDITANSAEVLSSEGFSVSLSCNYSVKANNLQWYRQYLGSSPQFLLLITDTQQPSVVPAQPPEPRLTAELNKERTQVHLKISSATVSDSAVYYCAVQPDGFGGKILFGFGSKLNVESETVSEPSFYKLSGDGTSACLASDFSRKKAAEEQHAIFSRSAAVLVEEVSLYNQLVLLTSEGEEEACEQAEDDSDVCGEPVEPDGRVNLMSVTMLGLRLLFFKTVVFNVLMTLRLWISQ